MDKFEPVMPGRQSQLPPLPADTPSATTREAVLPISQNTVLRNTYWLLALSLLPSIAGAFVGMQLNLAAFYMTSPIIAASIRSGAMNGDVM